MKNLPMDLLRTFVSVAQLNSFTRAGELLGRSQPAVSLQMQRLEVWSFLIALAKQKIQLLPT